MVDQRFTTENTGHYAGTWHDLPDGTKRYWTLEEVEAQRIRNRKGNDRKRVDAAIEVVRDRRAKRAPMARTTTAKPRALKTSRCKICDREFTLVRSNQATCGAERCKKEHRSRTQQKSRKAYEARQKEIQHATS